MAQKNKKGLGRGLDALLADNAGIEPDDSFDILAQLGEDDDAIQENAVKIIKIRDIEPNKNQPRKKFDEEKLEVLSESIKQHGLVQPILVKPNLSGTYTIVAGERRWRASKAAKLKEVPCIVRELTETEVMELALIENLQREDLNPIEEAEGYKRLIESCDMTQEDVAKRIGKSRSAIANSLRLNNLAKEVKQMVIDGKLTQGHARTLLGITDNEKQIETAKTVIENGLNVRQVEALISGLNNKKPTKNKQNISGMMKKYFSEVESELGSRYGTKVKISEGANKGKIEIEYYSRDDLERILFELKK